MIPILYDSSEIAFTNNGLGRLRDCISCVVTEERNGIYECDFEYPLNGANYDKIQLGRVIAVTHDDTGNVQPFDIVSYSKPINGIVKFHAVHISYRQSKLTVVGSNINSIADAFALLRTASPSNPFTYETDMVKTGYLAAANGIPRSVRQMLGGIEGSILDAYGGEYEWDGFIVRLLSDRGEQSDLTIRYGVNLLEYNEDTDYSNTYTAVIPYWATEEDIVVGSMVSSGQKPYNGLDNCVPLDLSEKFETQPTVAQLEEAAASYMLSNQTHLPSNSIEIKFVQLQDSNEYAQFAPLLKCRLCDSVKVIFPDYGTTGRFKIVKTVYNVLLERYDSLELGKLSTSLAEALGVTPSPGSSYSGGGGGGGGSAVTFYGTSSVAAATAAKTVTVDNSFALATGVMVTVKFQYSNSASSPTLNVNGSGAISIKRYGTTAPGTAASTSWNAGSAVTFVYDGTYWQMIGWLNTTYSEITATAATSSSGSTTGLASGRRLSAAVAAFESVKSVNGSTGTVTVQETLVSGTNIKTINNQSILGSGDLAISGGGGIDSITEQNKVGDWTYRKWGSGLVELWATVTITAQTNSSDAGGYVSAAAAEPGAFPFTLTETPYVQVTVNSGGITGSVTSVTRPSTTSAGSYKIYRNSSNTNTGNKDFFFYVIGKWK